MRAAKGPNEEQRLQRLRSLEILDTPPEQRFADLVDLAAEICGVDIALISFVEGERQWFKAETGLGICETPIEQSICAHALLDPGEVLEIRDTWDDRRTMDNPLCMGDEPIRFYAGAPLLTSDGLAMGTLCALHRAPHRLNDTQRRVLRVLADQVMKQIELTRALEEAAILRQEVDHRVKNSLQSVAALTRIQRRMAKGDEARDVLDLVQQRVMTVAALHELLYRTDAGDRVNLRQLLNSVSQLLGGSKPEGIDLVTDVAPITVSSDVAAGVATVVNEFASNAVKHAFAEGTGCIRIQGRNRGDSYEIECSDNGMGMPDSAMNGGAAGLGMRIIEAAAAQIGATLDLRSSEAGTTVTLTFAPRG